MRSISSNACTYVPVQYYEPQIAVVRGAEGVKKLNTAFEVSLRHYILTNHILSHTQTVYIQSLTKSRLDNSTTDTNRQHTHALTLTVY